MFTGNFFISHFKKIEENIGSRNNKILELEKQMKDSAGKSSGVVDSSVIAEKDIQLKELEEKMNRYRKERNSSEKKQKELKKLLNAEKEKVKNIEVATNSGKKEEMERKASHGIEHESVGGERSKCDEVEEMEVTEGGEEKEMTEGVEKKEVTEGGEENPSRPDKEMGEKLVVEEEVEEVRAAEEKEGVENPTEKVITVHEGGHVVEKSQVKTGINAEENVEIDTDDSFEACGSKEKRRKTKSEMKTYTTTIYDNKIAFQAVGKTFKSKHDAKLFGVRNCALHPACSVSFKGGEAIGKIKIISPEFHPYYEQEAWGCIRHACASLRGDEVQTRQEAESKKRKGKRTCMAGAEEEK